MEAGNFAKTFKEWYDKLIIKELYKGKRKFRSYFLKKPEKWNDLQTKYESSEIISKKNKILEKDIEKYISSNLGEIEEGLQFIANQFDTEEIGVIDILCKDKENNYVIIEVKKGRSSDKVVGQIQRYLSWVSKNLDENSGAHVRGIIICKEFDKKLIASKEASKYKIDVFKIEFSKLAQTLFYCYIINTINISLKQGILI